MGKSFSNESKINTFLKTVFIIQIIVIIVLLFLLIIKFINYNSSGNTINSWQSFAKCDFAYNCECPKLSKKCRCIYYDYNKEPERIKCNKDPNIN